MCKVTITRTTDRFRRTINGAWSKGHSETESFQMDESKLAPQTLPDGTKLPMSLNSGITVTWPDGVSESAFPFNGGASPGYPPICYPRDGRLARLINGSA